MSQQHADPGRAASPRGLDERLRFDAETSARVVRAKPAMTPRPTARATGIVPYPTDVMMASEQQGRDREQGVDDAHDQRVHPAAVEAGNDTQLRPTTRPIAIAVTVALMVRAEPKSTRVHRSRPILSVPKR